MNAQDHSYPRTSLSRPSVLAEWRAFLKIARRRWLTFVRYPSWIISLLVWPVIFPAVYIFSARALAGPDSSGLIAFAQNTGVTDYVGYIAVGTTVWMWQNIVLWNIGTSLRTEQVQGTLESNWLTPSWRFSLLLGNSVTHLVISFVMLITAALEFALFLGVGFSGSIWLVLLVALACIPSIYGLAFVFASLVIYTKDANSFVFLVRGLVMIFCGITFPISILPHWMQSVSAWLPPTYMIHAFRQAALGNADFKAIAPDLLALTGFGLFWLVTGYLSFVWMDKKTRQSGSLANH